MSTPKDVGRELMALAASLQAGPQDAQALGELGAALLDVCAAIAVESGLTREGFGGLARSAFMQQIRKRGAN